MSSKLSSSMRLTPATPTPAANNRSAISLVELFTRSCCSACWLHIEWLWAHSRSTSHRNLLCTIDNIITEWHKKHTWQAVSMVAHRHGQGAFAPLERSTCPMVPYLDSFGIWTWQQFFGLLKVCKCFKVFSFRGPRPLTPWPRALPLSLCMRAHGSKSAVLMQALA